MTELKDVLDGVAGSAVLMPGATQNELNDFLSRCFELLGVVPPVSYTKFLGVCNGAAGNGAFLYSTRRVSFLDCDGANNDFVEMNLNWRDLEWMEGYLIFGDDDMDIYVQQISTGIFQVRDRQVFDNVFHEFDCFDDLAVYVLGLMLVD